MWDVYGSAMMPVAAHWATWMVSISVQVAVFTGAIWGITRLMSKASASLRHLLWFMVFVKLLLPPSLSSPISVVSLVNRVTPLDMVYVTSIDAPSDPDPRDTFTPVDSSAAQVEAATQPTSFQTSIPLLAMSIWLAGALAFGAALTVKTKRYGRRVVCDLTPASPEVTALARELAERLDLSRTFRVCVSSKLQIAALMGYRRPIVILPEALASNLSRAELSDVIGHELSHIKRNDIPVGWLTSLLLSVYWFHPAVWLANFYLRREREMASDDAVLYSIRQDGKHYASTIIRMAERFDETAPAGVGFLGILEIAEDLLHRVRSAADGTRRRRMGRTSVVVAAALAMLLLPMAVWTPGTLAANAPAPSVTTAAHPAPVESQQDEPVVVSSDPEDRAVGVDPAKKVIQVKFNVDMAEGFSWTGGPPLFPKTNGKPKWVDARTCELPVELEAGKVYRVGINSTSFTNFQSEDGVAVRPRVIAFVTKGGDPALANALTAPKVVSMSPAKGAGDVKPSVDKLVVTFDKPMGGGCSWTGGGDQYPETTGKPTWSKDQTTCTLPVKLKPDWKYRFGLNSPSYNNFQSSYGVPLEPVVWTFTTGK